MSELNRRQLLQGAAAGTLLSLDPSLAQARADRDRIKAENDREGTTDWQLTYVRMDPRARYRTRLIEGYAGRASVKAGDSLDLFVSTDPAAPFVIDVYRLGYYQGKGGRHLTRLGPFEGKTQPTPPVGEERLRECRWEKCTDPDHSQRLGQRGLSWQALVHPAVAIKAM